MKRGRPKLIDVDANEKKKLRNKLCVQYHVDRYKDDEEFKEKVKRKSRENYQKTKETIKQQRRERYAKSKTDSSSEDTNSNDNDDIEDDVKSKSEENKI